MTTIDLAILATVTGGAPGETSVELNTETAAGKIGGKFMTRAGEHDPDKQLRCYSQVARQAGFVQSSRETLRQQLELCGPLRP